MDNIDTIANYKLLPDLEQRLETKINSDSKQRVKARQRLVELAKPKGELIFYPDGRVYRNDELIVEEPADDQKEWVLSRLSHANTWPKVHENKIGDYQNWDKVNLEND